MIHSVTANKTSFHAVTFEKGLNLIVAERTKRETDKNSRNGVGKSTLFRIIDFCLGSDVNKPGTFMAKYLDGQDWEFTLELDIRGQRVKVTRAVDNHKFVHIVGDVSGWPVPPDGLPLDGYHTFTIEQWRKNLGWALFDLPNVDGIGTNGKPDDAFSMPSAREMLHFFIRKGYASPLQPSLYAKTDELAISYLLGLNWEYVSRIGDVKKKEADAKTIESAAKLELAKWRRTKEALQAECNYLEGALKDIKTQLDDFNVLPGYAEIEDRVNHLTVEIHGLKNTVMSGQARLKAAKLNLERAQEALQPVDELYAECGLVFPDAVKETLERVRAFHEDVTGNRRIIIEKEIKRLEKSIAAANDRVRVLAEEKRAAMQVLKTHGALEEYTKLNQRYTDLARDLQRKLDCLQHLAEAKTSINALLAKKVEIAAEAKVEYEELRPTWDEAEKFFRDLAQEFYGSNGTLGIELVGEKRRWGFKFDPNIESDDSAGIRKIMICSFDMTLFHQQRVCQRPIDFLIQDSEAFDSTDPRQVAKALLAADRISRELGGQCICAINSDKLNHPEFMQIMATDVSEGFKRLTLSDESDATKLLGISFGRETEVPVAAPEAAEGADAGDGEPPDETASGQQQGE